MIAWTEALVVVAITTVVAAVFAIAGALALRLLRRRSLRLALAVVALTSAGVVAASVSATSALMLLDDHAVAVVEAASVIAGLAGLLVASVLARRLERGSAELTLAAQRIGMGTAGPAVDDPLHRGGDQPLELVAVARELRRTHARLEASRKREQALEGSRRELVEWMSHDLRTPLAGVRAMAEALDDGVVSDTGTTRAYLRRMVLETDRLTAMVNDLFDLSRLTAGAQPPALAELDLTALARSVADASAASAAQRGVRVVAGPAPAPAPGPASVLGDEAHLHRALRNIVDNAVRYTPAGTAVHVQVREHRDAWLVEVTDGCGGIPGADLPRLFDVGFRGERARTPGEHGAGLGLAIARGIVQAHDGEVRVGNRGAGCAFSVALPAAPAPGGCAPQPRPPTGRDIVHGSEADSG